jgi:hypothetical protein
MVSPRHLFHAASCPDGSVFAMPPVSGLRIYIPAVAAVDGRQRVEKTDNTAG